MPAPPAALADGELETLYRSHHQRLLRAVARAVHAAPATVEDACSFAWLQLHRHARVAHPKAWLLTVAVREAVRLDRGEHSSAPLPADAGGEDVLVVDPVDRLAASELALDTRALLTTAALTDRQIRLIGLYASGFTYREMAELTDQTVRTVERQLLRALRQLRDRRG